MLVQAMNLRDVRLKYEKYIHKILAYNNHEGSISSPS